MHGVHRSGWSHDSRSDILIILMTVANTSRIVNEEMLLYMNYSSRKELFLHSLKTVKSCVQSTGLNELQGSPS